MSALASLDDDAFFNVLHLLPLTSLVSLCETSQFHRSAYKRWVQTLPSNASELCFSRPHLSKDGEHYLKTSDGKPFLAYCTIGNRFLATTQSSSAASLAGSKWNFCDQKSNQGGAGYGSHFVTTHMLKFEPEGQLAVKSRDDAGNWVDEVSEGTWELRVEDGEDEGTCVLRFHQKIARLVYNTGCFAMTSADNLVACFLNEESNSDFASSQFPAAYLSLKEANFSTLASGGTVHGDTVRTNFRKVRIILPELRILCSDFTFADSEGTAYVVGSNGSTNTNYDCSLFGFAQGSCGPAAHAKIDLTGTPFAVDAQFLPTGCGPRGMALHDCMGQVVLVSGTGGQGACAPTWPGTDAAQYPCCDDGNARLLWTKGGCYDNKPFVIQLAHLEGNTDRFSQRRSYGSCYDSCDNCPEDWRLLGALPDHVDIGGRQGGSIYGDDSDDDGGDGQHMAHMAWNCDDSDGY